SSLSYERARLRRAASTASAAYSQVRPPGARAFVMAQPPLSPPPPPPAPSLPSAVCVPLSLSLIGAPPSPPAWPASSPGGGLPESGPASGCPPLHVCVALALFRGAAACTSKSAELLSVSVQPPPLRSAAFVLLSAATGPLPS